MIIEMLQSYMVNLQCSGVSEFDEYVIMVLSLEGEKNGKVCHLKGMCRVLVVMLVPR